MVKLNENTSYKRGQELLDSGQYEEAIAKFAEVVQKIRVHGKPLTVKVLLSKK